MKGFNFQGTVNLPHCHVGDGTFCCGKIYGETRTFKTGIWIYKNVRVTLTPGDTLYYCISVEFFKRKPQVRCNFTYVAPEIPTEVTHTPTTAKKGTKYTRKRRKVSSLSTLKNTYKH